MNSRVRWNEAAVAAVYAVALRKLTFTADDVWAELGCNHGRDNRALGSAMRQAARLQYCKATEAKQKTNRALSHRRPLTVWASLIFVHIEDEIGTLQ